MRLYRLEFWNTAYERYGGEARWTWAGTYATQVAAQEAARTNRDQYLFRSGTRYRIVHAKTRDVIQEVA